MAKQCILDSVDNLNTVIWYAVKPVMQTVVKPAVNALPRTFAIYIYI